MRLSIAFFFASLAFGQLSLVTEGTTPTQVVLSWSSSASCTVEVSESSTFYPLVSDTSPAAADSRWSVLASGAAKKAVVNGLAADAAHWARVTCGGTSQVVQFRTRGTLPLAPIAATPQPAMNFSRGAIDPQTGVRWKSAGFGVSGVKDETPTIWTGGASWTNFGNLVSTGATTTNTNPAFVAWPFDPIIAGGYNPLAQAGLWQIADVGAVIVGSGTDATAANREIEVCISIDNGTTCAGTAFTVILPQTTPSTQVIYGSASTPQPGFAAWGYRVPLPLFPKRGIVSASGTAVTLTANSAGTAIGSASEYHTRSYFSPDWTAGQKIRIVGACPADYCEIAAVNSPTSLTIVESSPSITGAEYETIAVGFRVVKKTATGSVTFSLRPRYAATRGNSVWTGGCSSSTVSVSTAADGSPLGRTVTGYSCIFPQMRQGTGDWFLVVPELDEIRLLSSFRSADSSPDGATTAAPRIGPTVSTFSPSNAAVAYLVSNTNSGGLALFRATYNGDFRSLASDWLHNIDFSTVPSVDTISYENLTKPSEGRSLTQQVVASPQYNASIWGASPTLSVIGVVGSELVTARVPAQDSACLIITFSLATGNLSRIVSTAADGAVAGLRYAGCHAVIERDNQAIEISNNGLKQANSSHPLGGPFTSPVSHVWRSGTPSTNTALPWPIDSSYDNTCPADIPQEWKDRGAAGNRCAKIRFSRQPCSATPTTAERTALPCAASPGDSSQILTIAVGDFFIDQSQAGWDNERLAVVKIDAEAGGAVDAWVLRDAAPVYCCHRSTGLGGLRCAIQNNTQMTHTTSWVARAWTRDACGGTGTAAGNSLVLDLANNTSQVWDMDLSRSHYHVKRSGGLFNLIGAAVDGNGDYAFAQGSGSVALQRYLRQWPTFSGFAGGGYATHAGTHQSYIYAAGVENSFDFRHLNGSTGTEIERPGQTLGVDPAATLQGGTSTVYKVTVTGTIDVRRGVIHAWAGDRRLYDMSSAATGDQITDATPWRYCIAYRAGECRTGSSAGDVFVSVPGLVSGSCEASQLNRRKLCIFSGLSVSGQIVEIRQDAADPTARRQRLLGAALAETPAAQYTYSKVVSVGASHIVAAGHQIGGWWNGLMLARLPRWDEPASAASTFVPVRVAGPGTSYVEFGYDANFYCTSRAEPCRVAASTINESAPFVFAGDSLVSAEGPWVIPAIPGRVLYYRIGTGATQVVVP